MSFEISTGLQNQLALALIAALDGKVLTIYGHADSKAAADALIPADAADAVGSALKLCTISVNGTGTGLTFDPTPVDGAIYKESTELWKGEILASGYNSFYRLHASSDDNLSASTTLMRCQGSVGAINKDLLLSSDYMTLGEEQRIDSYLLAILKE